MQPSGHAHLIPIDRIVSMLTDRIEQLCRDLLPLGRRDNGEWREASTKHGGLGDSLAVHIGGGSRRGIWSHFADNSPSASGDALDLVAYIRFAGNKSDALRWSRSWLGIGDGSPAPAEAAPALDRQAASDRDARDAEGRRRSAYGIFLAAKAGVESSPVGTYLAGRGLDIRRLPFPLGALRYHPGLLDRHTNRRWPAMVAGIVSHTGTFMAAHMTFLDCLSDGQVVKAPIVDDAGKVACKRVLGRFRGGAIRLWNGAHVDAETGEVKKARRLADCKPGQWIDLVEGIEDGLTVALADNTARVICGVSLGNMTNLELPACVTGVVFWRQNDAPGSSADLSSDRVVQHFLSMGREVAEARPPAGIKDANDMVRHEAAAQ